MFSKLLQNLVESLLEEEKISGLWIEPNVKYLTKYGIQRRMMDAKGFIDLQTFIEEVDPSEEQVSFLEKIMQELIANRELDGVYDEDNQIYQSKDVAGEASLNTERERFTKEINPYIEDLEFGYLMCQEVLMRPDTTPQDIEEYQELLDANKKKILYAEAFIRKWINNADTRLSLAYKQQKIGQKRGKRSRELPKMEKQKFSDDEIVTQLLNNFSSWKELIWAISQKAGKIVILKKKIKFNPEDTESQNELANILEYLGFHN